MKMQSKVMFLNQCKETVTTMEINIVWKNGGSTLFL